MRPAELLSDILRVRVIGDPCRALLVAMVTTEADPKCHRGCYSLRDDGMVRICREELSAALGDIGLKAVSNRIAEAKRAGLLKQASGGHNGTVAGYRLVRPYRRPGPDSLADLLAATLAGTAEDPLVGTTGVVPETGQNALVGTTGVAPYARAHYSTATANPETPTAESRVFLFGTEVVLARSPGTGERPTGEVIPADGRDSRDNGVTGKSGNYGDGWIPAPSRRPSSRHTDGEAA